MIQALFLALALMAAPQAAPAPVYKPVGVAEAQCGGGVKFGMPPMIRGVLGCHMAKVAGIDPAGPDLAAAFRQATTAKIGRAELRTASDALVARWAADPRTSLAPRPGFRPVRVEALEYAETDGYDRTINPTGGFGVASHETHGLTFRGQLVAEGETGPVTAPISGQLVLERGSWMLSELDIGAPAGKP
ncbi:hypothetical protein [Caulobacter hibisci]|uniref:Uncharacterized protein n=1 Tax=Caulobacter hibisci TaxID=2035993 RepID=A0ABS0T2U6_9CAUL|nr:hypothetical protein [Caulobacter hibisci]MBI1686202.1 hypothetical protein [Caulobacter hibisci]